MAQFAVTITLFKMLDDRIYKVEERVYKVDGRISDLNGKMDEKLGKLEERMEASSRKESKGNEVS